MMKMKNNYLIYESLMSSLSVYIILKKLMANWTEWDAFKLGIIDKDGNKKKHPISSKEREAWDILTRLCWNLKKLITKFAGKSQFAQYFSAAYLLKDSIIPYIKLNQQKLDETLLADMTITKQNTIYNALQDLPKHNNLATAIHNNLVNETHNNIVEVEIYKCLQMVEDVLSSHNKVQVLFEDESGATVQADIAQHGEKLGMTKKINPFKNIKKKRKLKDENNE